LKVYVFTILNVEMPSQPKKYFVYWSLNWKLLFIQKLRELELIKKLNTAFYVGMGSNPIRSHFCWHTSKLIYMTSRFLFSTWAVVESEPD